MLQAAAEALPKMLTPEDHARGVIYPRVGEIRKISAHIAAAVMRMADEEGLSSDKASIKMSGMNDEELIAWVTKKMFKPDYGACAISAVCFVTVVY